MPNLLNRIVNTEGAHGMWIKLHSKHKTIHFVQDDGVNKTLCGCTVTTDACIADWDVRDCPTCTKLVYELAPTIARYVAMIDKELQ